MLTTNKNFPPSDSTLLKRLTAAGTSGTQWRQEKEVTREKVDLLEEMKESPWFTSSCWNERLESVWVEEL